MSILHLQDSERSEHGPEYRRLKGGLVASLAILRILLSDIGWLPVAGLLKPIVLIDLFMPQRTQENQPIDLAVRNNTTYHTADGIKISNMFG